MKLFFYQVYEFQWYDETRRWEEFGPEESFETKVILPQSSVLQGFDVTAFSAQNSAECSPLSCNLMADKFKVNAHCLLNTFNEAKVLIESGALKQCEPGPYRIFEVHSVE